MARFRPRWPFWRKRVTTESEEPVIGGLYVLANREGGYCVCKVLHLSGGVAYVRAYSNVFQQMPNAAFAKPTAEGLDRTRG